MKKVSNDTDLKLALGYSKRPGKTKKNDSGAGVNASSGFHLFTSPDPLSELVWSPQKGVSLKCADTSIANNKPFLVWNVVPSSNDLSAPSEIVRFSSVYDEIASDEGKGYRMEKSKPAGTTGVEEKDQMMTGKEEDGENHAGGEENQNAVYRLEMVGPTCNPAVTKSVPTRGSEVAASSCSRNEDNASYPISSDLPLQKTPLKELQPSRSSEPIITPLPESTLKQIERTAENDVQNSTIKEGSKLKRNNSMPIQAYSTQIRTSSSCSHKRKGKSKALSDGDEEEDTSHESVESCNGTRVSLGRNKRMKKQTEIESSDVTPKAGGNSSFMTWISSMVNGFSNPNQEDEEQEEEEEDAEQEEVPSLALALTRSTLNHVGINYATAIDKNIEFQAKFHSLYSSPEKRASKDELSAGESKDVFLDDKMVIEVSPLTCHREENCDDKIINTTDMEEEAGASSPKSPIMSQNCKSNSPENKKKAGGSSSGSMCMLKTGNNGESSSPSHHSENKATKNTSDISSLQSFWITRFSVRDPNTALNLPECRENKEETANCAKPDLDVLTSEQAVCNNKDTDLKGTFPEDPDCDMLLDIPRNNTLADDASIAFKDDNKSIHKLNPITPSQKLKSSEAMTSLFARRLDAFKHIIPPDSRNEATCMTKAICLFCGRTGHDLHSCLEADEIEQEDLLRNNMCSYEWAAEGSHSFCIRCFKLDHWAVTCPMASSGGGGQFWGKQGNYCSNGSNFVGKEEGCSKVMVNHIGGGWKEKSRYFTDANSLVHNPKSSVPNGAFDAIRRLRVSRGDILKWLNSNASLSHLDGFFLRLRLGRWEQGGLGGTGYYIARIAESQKDHSTKDSKCISVSFCGIVCSIGSQYVSNHDFLEDELMTWWCKTS
ncbi:unnamed protein product, partial [Cuscuta europaea]